MLRKHFATKNKDRLVTRPQ